MNYFKEEQYIAWMDTIAEEDFVVIDNFIDDDMFQEISTFFEEKLVANDLEKAGIGAMGLHVVEKKIRGDYVYWLEENELSAHFIKNT